MRRAAGGRRQRGAEDAEEDRGHREVLVAPRPLAEHPLGDEHQHDKAGCEGRLHDDERRQQQGHDLQRKPQDGEPGAEQPARAFDQTPGKRQAQVLLAWRLLGVHRLEGDP